MIQFFAPDIRDTLTLPESDSGHAVRVLRLQIGDEVTVVDGVGHRYTCRLVDNHPKRARVAIISTEDVKPVWSYDITIAVAPTKNMDRMEWLVEKLVEIGVNRIVPLKCRHSERKEIKVERLEKIAVSAMKQSLKATLPTIDEMTPIATFLAEMKNRECQKFMGYCDDAVQRRLLARSLRPATDTVIMIGPEGDFSPEEVATAIDAGFVPVTLGDNRLRTETAALVGADTCHIINQALAQ